MFLLTRRISPYTGADLLLGVYTTESRANAARHVYIQQTAADDPFTEQAFYTIDLKTGTVVLPLTGDPGVGPEVFIVSDIGDMFGQVIRDVCGGYGTLTAAAQAARVVKRSSGTYGLIIERLVVDARPRTLTDASPYCSPISVDWDEE